MFKVTALPRSCLLAFLRIRCSSISSIFFAFILAGCQSESPQEDNVQTDNSAGEVVTVLLSGATTELETADVSAEPLPDLQSASSLEVDIADESKPEQETDLSKVDVIPTVYVTTPVVETNTESEAKQEIGEETVPDLQVTESVDTDIEQEISEETVPDLQVTESVDTDIEQEIGEETVPDLQVTQSVDADIEQEIGEETMPDLQVTEPADTDLEQEISEETVSALQVIGSVDTDIEQGVGEETVPDLLLIEVVDAGDKQEIAEESVPNLQVMASVDTVVEQEIGDENVSDLQLLGSEDTDDSQEIDEAVPELLAALSDPRNPDDIPIAQQAGLMAETQTTADIDFSTSFFVDSVEGSDSHSGSFDTPFKSIEFAQSQLTPGSTLYLREGVYFERNVEIKNSGDENNIISIKNYPGEKAVINGSFEEFYTVNVGNWELYDSETNTYRSTVGNLDTSVLSAYAINSRGEWQRLVSYMEESEEKSSGLDDLISTIQHVDANSRYVGPGIFNDAGQIYIRLEPLESETVLEREVSDVKFPLDPNKIQISIGSAVPVVRLESSHVLIEGVTITGGAKGVVVEPSASNIVLRNNTYLGLSIAVLAEEGVSYLEIDHSEFDARFPTYIAWTDMKGTDGQSKPAAYWMNKLAGLSAKSIDTLKFTNNYFNDIFDGAVLSGSNVEISGNAGFFFDDFVQLGSDSSNVQVFDNRISGAGPSHYGRGNSPLPGTIFVYKNVIKTAREILWGKFDPNNILRDGYSGWGEQQAFQSHAKSAVKDGDPWKIYNNTVIFNSVANNFGIGIEIFGEENSTGEVHEVFNNIFVELGGGIYTKNFDLTIADQVYDGNIYWTEATRLEPMFYSMESSVLGSSHFDSLIEFRASEYFDESVDLFGMGWELNGLQANPELSSALVPAAGSPAATSNVLLPSSFPSSDMQFRGAIGAE